MGVRKKTLKPSRLIDLPDGTVQAWYRIADLTLDENNARTHGARDLNATGDSVEQFDQQKPVVVDRDGIVRAGNGTCLALIARGHTEVWAVRSDLQGDKAVAYGLADNRTGELSAWDYSQVAKMLTGLQSTGFDINRLGWTDYELEPLLMAEWQPAEKENLPGLNNNGVPGVQPVALSEGQRQVIDRAVETVRARLAEEITEGSALEIICTEWLNAQKKSNK